MAATRSEQVAGFLFQTRGSKVKKIDKSAFALEDTLAVYGIHDNPFPIDEADDLFFSTATLTGQMDVLRNLLEFSDLVLVVSGVEGAGKTAFLNQFLLAADSRWKCCRIDAGAVTSLDGLHQALLAGFGARARDDEAGSDEALLRTHLSELRAGGHIAIVAVDDAHLLSPICSEFLLSLAEDREHTGVHLLLTTEPGRLAFPTDDAKRVHVVVLRPFDAQECGDYIRARLRTAGLDGKSPFDDAVVVDAIHQDSGGVPGTIHAMALHALLANTDIARLSHPRAKITRPVVYLLGVLAVAGVAALMLTPASQVAPVGGGAGTSGTVRGRVAGIDMPSARPAAAQEPPAPAAAGTRPQRGGLAAQAPAAGSGATPGESVTVLSGNDAKVFRLDDGGAGAQPASVTEPPAAVKGAPPGKGAPTVRLATNVTPAIGAPVNAGVAHDSDWLRQQDPSSYVIQLVGTRDAAAVGRFLEQHKLGSKGAWFVTSLDDKPWYVVVYGMYPSSAKARAAIATLPPTLRAGAPWPRSVASVIDSAR